MSVKSIFKSVYISFRRQVTWEGPTLFFYAVFMAYGLVVLLTSLHMYETYYCIKDGKHHPDEEVVSEGLKAIYSYYRRGAIKNNEKLLSLEEFINDRLVFFEIIDDVYNAQTEPTVHHNSYYRVIFFGNKFPLWHPGKFRTFNTFYKTTNKESDNNSYDYHQFAFDACMDDIDGMGTFGLSLDVAKNYSGLDLEGKQESLNNRKHFINKILINK
jgi:hypothetical protein